MLGITDVKTGKKIVLEGEPYAVLSHEHSKTGRAGAVLRTKLRNLVSGAVMDKTFQGSALFEEANLAKTQAQYLYTESEECYFMDMESYDQFSLSKDALGMAPNYLTEGLTLIVLSFNGQPVSIELPVKVTLRVTDAPPGLKGDTQSGGDKLVTTETGATFTTPLFVNVDDQIVINTEKGTYVSKVS